MASLRKWQRPQRPRRGPPLRGIRGRHFESLRELSGVPRAPDANFTKLPNDSERFEMALGLDAGTKDSEHRDLAACE